jgi:hypothetical protein
VAEPTRLRGIWWLSPAGAAAMIAIPTLIAADRVPDSAYRQHWRTPKILDHSHAHLFAAGILVFLAGAMWPLLNRRPAPTDEWMPMSDELRARLVRVARWLYRITMVGYLTFALQGLRHGITPIDLLHALLKQNVYGTKLKDAFAPIVGITTLTQVGIAFLVVATYLLAKGPVPGLRPRMAFLFLLGFTRAFFLAERLAFLELALPTVCVFVLARTPSRRPGRGLFLQLTPALILPGVLVLFGLLEYSRSYNGFYAKHSHESVVDFTLNRIEGYYATSYNNAALLLEGAGGPGHVPYYSIEALWTAPGMDQLHIYDKLTDDPDPDRFGVLMDQRANPEFNNPGGVGIPFLDYGRWGGLVYLAVAGSALGLLYRNCCDGRPFGVFLYPALVTSTFEMPRYLYWTSGRVTPAIVALVLVAWSVRAEMPVPAPIPAGAGAGGGAGGGTGTLAASP